MSQPRYKSEMFVPIKQDQQTFEERQKNIWEDMHVRMERRRQEWEYEVDRMRKDFFQLKPNETRRGSSENLLESVGLDNVFYDTKQNKGDEGAKTFRVSFDVSQFKPDEINVRTEESKLYVKAKHEEKASSGNMTHEFSRTVDIPKNVDPAAITCTMSNDGILQVEAPVSAPAYQQICNTASTSLNLNRPPSLGGGAGQLQTGPMVTEQDGTRKFKISVEVGKEYGAQDISVKTVDRKLVVHARHEEKTPGRTSFREFNKEYDLPEDVDPNTVVASMSEAGVLMVEAPISSYSQGSFQGKPGSTKQPKMTILLQK
eukprot:GHVU01114519.1.p1 GENE.GHVU01114519.1~~GHVU01114519.1.p1  ORF type:complete len:315 (+),score=41.81 GHVU01114519.1:573-1517(+)